jgi:hypothetical protein
MDDVSSALGPGQIASAAEMNNLSRSFDALTASTLVAGGAAAGAGGGASYIAMTSSGRAGAVSGPAAMKAQADSVEMSIVAAIPPRPPPIESSSVGADVPRARGHAAGHSGARPQHEHKDAADAVSASKIEGSVDAIAQRIYHRIRRKIQDDRERFGG